MRFFNLNRIQYKWIHPLDYAEIQTITRGISKSDTPRYIDEVIWKWCMIEEILEEETGLEFPFSEKFKAAQLLYNQYDGLLPVDKSNAGKKPIQEMLTSLHALKRELKIKGELAEHIISDIPEPFKFEVLAWRNSSKDKVSEYLLNFISYFETQLSEQLPRTNQRAYRVALALRSVFEYYSRFPVTVAFDRYNPPHFEFPVYNVTTSRNEGIPCGPFMRSLERIYELVGINATIHHYASKAKKTPNNDKIFKRNWHLLRRRPTDQTRYFPKLTEFGWTKSWTWNADLREIYEDLYSYRELKNVIGNI